MENHLKHAARAAALTDQELISKSLHIRADTISAEQQAILDEIAIRKLRCFHVPNN